MRDKTVADRKVKQKAMVKHLDRMQRLDRTKGKLVQPPVPEVNNLQLKPKASLKTEPKTASFSKDDFRNRHHKEDWENQIHILPFFNVIIELFKLFFKLIELSLAVIGVYVGETRREYQKLLRENEGKTDAELENDIDDTLSKFTLTNWVIFLIGSTFKAFRSISEFARDMFTLAIIALKRDRRILTLRIRDMPVDRIWCNVSIRYVFSDRISLYAYTGTLWFTLRYKIVKKLNGVTVITKN